jgi:hypothetical protein
LVLHHWLLCTVTFGTQWSGTQTSDGFSEGIYSFHYWDNPITVKIRPIIISFNLFLLQIIPLLPLRVYVVVITLNARVSFSAFDFCASFTSVQFYERSENILFCDIFWQDHCLIITLNSSILLFIFLLFMGSINDLQGHIKVPFYKCAFLVYS